MCTSVYCDADSSRIYGVAMREESIVSVAWAARLRSTLNTKLLGAGVISDMGSPGSMKIFISSSVATAFSIVSKPFSGQDARKMITQSFRPGLASTVKSPTVRLCALSIVRTRSRTRQCTQRTVHRKLRSTSKPVLCGWWPSPMSDFFAWHVDHSFSRKTDYVFIVHLCHSRKPGIV
jgi:hypothetical protein